MKKEKYLQCGRRMPFWLELAEDSKREERWSMLGSKWHLHLQTKQFYTDLIGSFHAKHSQKLDFFLLFTWRVSWMKSVAEVWAWYSAGVLVTIFVSHSFLCFNDLDKDSTTTKSLKTISFHFVFNGFQKNSIFCIQQGNKDFWSFECSIPVKMLKSWTTLKCNLQKNLTWIDFEKRNRVLPGGTVCHLWFLEHKTAWLGKS